MDSLMRSIFSGLSGLPRGPTGGRGGKTPPPGAPGTGGLAGGSAQCRLLCSAKPVHSGYSCEPPCWLLLGEITPAGPYGSWVTWPVLRLGEFALSDAANHTFHFDGIFLLRTSRLQSRQARVHHILRTRKADPPRVQVRRLGCDQNRRPHEVVGRHP